MRHLIITAALMLVSSLAVAADFNAGMTAYERQDYKTAAEEFSALAEAGDYHAQYLLGRLYAEGNGVAQNKVQAYKWYDIAASRGHIHAAQARDTLARDMRRARITEAQKLARQWRPGTNAPLAAQPMSDQELSAAIQQSLNTLGYDAGTADGVMGGKTRAAIRDYQKDQGVAVDGQPSQALLRRLEESLRAAGIETGAPAYAATGTSPWRRLVLHDSFADGDYTRNPVWTVSAGRFTVESGVGLRTVHVPLEPVAQTRSQDLPLAILSAILGQTAQSGGSQAGATDYSEIHVNQSITNAFAMQLVLTLNQEATGTLAFGPYQSGNSVSGYRLVYTPHVDRGLHLVRITPTGTSVTESVDPQFRPNRQYLVQWTRDLNGEMTVSIDRKVMLRVTDRSYVDPFAGFTLVNRGGDYALREITIHGVE